MATSRSEAGAAGRQRRLAGVVVLGMSRSGTSVVTGLFKDAGFYAGAEDGLMEANEYNPRGYNENMRVYTENERILGAAGGSWFDPPEPEALQVQAAEIETVRSLMREMSEEANGAPVIVKDPRIGVLLPIWGPVLDELLHPVLTIRDPVEIAMSLSRRDGTPTQSGLGSWEIHTTALLASLAGREVTVVHYAEVLENTRAGEAAVQAAAEFLDADLRAHIRVAQAGGGVDPGLHHNRVTDTQHDQWLTGFQRELWDCLRSLPAGTQRLDIPDRFTQATANAREAVRAASTAEQLRLEIERQRLEIERLRQQQAELEAFNQRLSGSLDAIAGSLSWRMTQPLRDAAQALREHRR